MIIKLKIKLLSYNQYYRNSRTGRRIKTGAGLAYDEELEMLLEDNAKALIKFGESLDLSKEIVKIEIYNFKSNFFKKDGSLHTRSGDWDNPVKVLQDKLFAKMGLDDYVVKTGQVINIPSSEDAAIIKLSTYPIPELVDFETYQV